MSSRTGSCFLAHRVLLWACVIVALAGCSRTDVVTSDSTSPEDQEPVSLTVADAERLEELIAARRGKVVLVDFWATWCAPCLEQFPHTVALHRKYQDHGLAVISVSLDEPARRQQVLVVLRRNDASFENLLSTYGGGTEAIAAFGLPGPVPCYRLYGRSGELQREFTVDPSAERQFTPADIEAAVEQLLETS